jgi:hypothetical protein
LAATYPKEIRKDIERRAWDLRQRFWTHQRIADELKVDRTTITRCLARIERRLARDFVGRAERIKVRQTYQLENIAADAFAQWERSKLDAETVKVTEEAGCEGQPPGSKTETTLKGQCGDPGLLNQIRGALSDIRDIWGLDAPEKKQLGGDPNNPVLVKTLKGVTIDDI